jgi:2-polyprenyl-3-methyl-5-hydroxy-6-metoxy-1,4-benzoquinol methylase
MSEQATPTNPGRQEDLSTEYGRDYYRHYCGVPYERNDHWLGFFAKIADEIVRDLRPTSVLDAGCAMGFLVEALRERGVEAWGIDVSEYAISQVDDSVADYCRVASIAEPLPRRYDLIVSIEVLEHIPSADTGAALASLCSATDRLLLSTTPDDYAEATHHNVQAPEDWAAALAQERFLRDLDHDVSYVTPWASLYLRRDEPLAETVRRYDRSWNRHRREVDQVRSSLIAAQERFAELEDETGGSRPELLAELDRKQEEILRLRDQLMGMNAELGVAKGYVAQMEDRAKRLKGAQERVESQIPVFGRIAGKLWNLVRRLRDRR